MQYLGHTETEQSFIVSLKFEWLGLLRCVGQPYFESSTIKKKEERESHLWKSERVLQQDLIPTGEYRESVFTETLQTLYCDMP